MKVNYLIVIPARGGSKGIPGKNIKLLGNKPLLHYSLEYARQFVSDQQICLSTDDSEIAACAAQINYQTKFLRPASLATDNAGTYEVLQHALSIYDPHRNKYSFIVLLQPTSPFRAYNHLVEAKALYNNQLDMVVSVCQAKANPYFTLFEEGSEGYLSLSKGNGQYLRRQDAPEVYQYNGSIYIINTNSLQNKKGFRSFSKIKKYLMPDAYSIDLDHPEDWLIAEYLLQHKFLHEHHQDYSKARYQRPQLGKGDSFRGAPSVG